ncbi:hypothetical protein [Bizionia psychrotolerans]|uniref:hypothetical protein n=1 Tax=Bizionia psychrotolerans TaxID=1492901 RepID=UPI0012E06879|nr:hypothetical protein [Bizionia psychrotolerans]
MRFRFSKIAQGFSLLFVLLILNFSACIPVKNVQDVSGYKIVNGDETADDDIAKLNKFTFQIYKKPAVFSRYLRDRYSDEAGFNSHNFRVEEEGVWINFSVLSDADSSKYIDFTDVIFKKDDPELYKKGKDKYFISITAKTDTDENCLKIDSFYRYIISRYLNDIRMGFNAYN